MCYLFAISIKYEALIFIQSFKFETKSHELEGLIQYKILKYHRRNSIVRIPATNLVEDWGIS